MPQCTCRSCWIL